MSARVLRYCTKLEDLDCIKVTQLASGHLLVEAIVQHIEGQRGHSWLAWVARTSSFEGRSSGPSLSRVDAGRWRIEPWPWERYYREMPPKLSLMIAGAPDEWPRV